MTPEILMVAGDYPPVLGGIADYTRQLSNALVRRGTGVTILTSSARDLPEVSAEDGVRVIRTMDGWRMRDLPRLLAVLDAERPDTMLHVQYPAVAFRRDPMINLLPALLRIRRPERATIVTVHDARVMRRRWRARVAPMLAAARAVLHVDPPDGESLRRWTWGNRPVSACIPIGTSISPVRCTAADRESWREELDLSGDAPVVAFFGMLYPHKGLRELVRAVERLRRRGSAVRLLVVGDFDRETSYERALATLFRPGSEAGWLRWLRGADEQRVSRALWAADAAALPFHSGAASNRSSLLASLAHGLPTVSTRGPATPPDFESYFPVSLVPVEDEAALARAIEEALRRPRKVADEGGAVARTIVPDWDEIADRHLELYARLASRPHAA